MSENPRIEELRRRVQKDPASIAFAQLAEEHRRAGDYEEAVRVCHAGLERHPSYLSARVTLGRTLIELERYPEAQTELEFVLRSAPENLAAIRGLAEIHQRRGDLNEALRQYQTALGIAKHDPELEESVHDLSRQLGAPAAPAPVAPPPIPVDAPVDMTAAPPELETFAPISEPPALSDPPPVSLGLEAAADEFTKALQALDALSLNLASPAVEQAPAPLLETAPPEMALPETVPSETAPPEPVLADASSPAAAADPFLDLEPPHASQDVEPSRPLIEVAHPVLSGDDAVADELESWLDAIVLDRNERALASQAVNGNQEGSSLPDLPDLPVNSNS